MTHVFPFRALRYDRDLVDPSKVVTQPYDKITPEMQARYYDASPYNLVRIILGRAEAGDELLFGEQAAEAHIHLAKDPHVPSGNNVYTRAAAAFRQWRRDEILRRDPSPAIYAYSQRFCLPGSGEEMLRRGFIALSRILPYEAGVVFRHEQTLAKPRADRLNLLRATRAHFGQIFMLYSDPSKSIDALLAGAKPEVSVSDEFGVRHELAPIADPFTIDQIVRAMADKQLIIADGHHRYETALAYKEEREAIASLSEARSEAEGTSAAASAEVAAAYEEAERELDRMRASSPVAVTSATRPNLPPYSLVMMTFVNMDAEGLVILPTHRVVHDLPAFDADVLWRKLYGYFHLEPLPLPDPAQLMARLADAGKFGTAFVAATRNDRYLLRAKGDLGSLLDSFSPRQRELDLVRLHRIILEHILGLSEEDIRQQRNVSYHRSAAEALDRVRSGANVAFLVNPVTVKQTRDIALAGEVLPQKSTDFYPKMLSGLTIYAMD